MATRLRAAGHEAGAFVGAFPLDSRFGLDAGFAVYNDRVGATGQSSDFLIAERPAETVVSAALQWLGDRTEPWFAWVHLFDPHAAYAPPAPFDRQYADAPYLGEVAYTDRSLGPLFDAVRRAPRPTLLIVTADHGKGLGDHGELTHGVLAYESTLRVPLIVAQLGPGTRPWASLTDCACPPGISTSSQRFSTHSHSRRTLPPLESRCWGMPTPFVPAGRGRLTSKRCRPHSTAVGRH